jgi:gamma-glutamylcyclotransferase (GGCT)/AIG2-like uncharacterized protein YtfP
MSEQFEHVFCYGTLKRGGGLHYHLETTGEFVCEAKIHGKLYQPQWVSFPAAVKSDCLSDWVHGELFLLRDAGTLATLDRVEGTNSGLYGRYRVKIYDDASGAEFMRAWTYFWGRELG